MSSNDSKISKREFIQRGKTRIQSLKDRIDIAYETLRNLYDESKLEKINQKVKEKKEDPTAKVIQYDLEEVANKIVSKDGEVNLKTIKIPGQENNLEEGEYQASEDIEIISPFMRRMQNIIKELNLLKDTSNIDEAEIDKEVASLPNRGLIELSLSKTLLKRKNENIIKSNEERNKYVKKLEGEVVEQRISLEELKKAEGEHLLQISTLQDQIRILKAKVFGYDIAKKYEYYKEHESANGPSAHIQDENLAFSMWEKENYGERRAPTKLSKLENDKQMWIANPQNNINKLENDVKLANSYRAGKNLGINNDEDNGLWTKPPEQAKNRNGINGFNNYGNGYRRYDAGNNQGNVGNMGRYSNMIINNNNNKKY